MKVGPFQLQRVIGQGGMATVWEATHSVLDLSVAIKVIKGDHARASVYRESFARELRSVARLDHPAIIQLYDHGVITDSEAANAPAGFLEGMPWMAMELVDGGSLDLQIPIRSFPQLQSIIVGILEALAYAHSRGVIHRDLKPTNILSSQAGLRVSDFGIARLGKELTGKTRTASGTPAYMAPEQVLGLLGEQGPWTDLYGLGCLVYKLVTGAGPFIGDIATVIEHHISTPAPVLIAPFNLPEGLQHWLTLMLEKDPYKRFRRAADAAHALRNLTGGEAHQNVQLGRAPPFSSSWQREGNERAPYQPLRGVGLSLYGLRPIPLVGRQGVQEDLWGRLKEVWSTMAPRVCALQGEAGAGKSRLMEWFGERAHAMGCAQVMKGRYDPVRRTLSGMAGMVARDLRCQYETPANLPNRLRKRLRRAHYVGDINAAAQALADVIHPSVTKGPATDTSTTSLFFRYQTIANYLKWRARERPLLLLIDDAQWGLDAIGLVDFILSHEPALPVLFVLGIQRAESATLAASASWQRINTRAEMHEIPIGPLDPAAHTQLVREALGVHEELVRQIAQRTSGLPLFAIQMVGDLVSRGVLRPGPQGYRLRAGARLRLPEDIQAVWKRRIARLNETIEEDVSPTLEVAAALGAYVPRHEWHRLCDRLGIAIPPELEGALVEQGLAQGYQAGWKFEHGLLRESLEYSSRQAGRWQEINLACAALIRQHPETEDGTERVGLHLFAAGTWRESLVPLLKSASERESQGVFHRAEWLYEQALTATKEAGLGAQDPALRVAHMGKARNALQRGFFGRAIDGINRMELLVGPDPSSTILKASIHSLQGDYQVARRLLEKVSARLPSDADPRLQARIDSELYRVGTAAPSVNGDLIHLGLPTLAKLEELEDGRALCRHLMLVAAWHNNIGENELAIHHATRAVTILRNQAVPMLLALGLGLLASFLTGAGHQEEARNLYQEARDLLRSMSASGGFVVECQVNVKLILEDHFEEIESWALRARSFMGAPERRHRSYALVEGIILVCTAATGRWTKWDEARRNLEKLFRQDTWEHYRLVMLLERTGDIANTAGRPQEAGWAYKLAHRCCLGLRREETSTRLKTKLIAARNMSGDVR